VCPTCNWTSFVPFSTKKNIIINKIIKKSKILCGVIIWVYMLAKKFSSHLGIGGTYLLHKPIEAL
jgi:hypothetical protein